eukprot:maker-scaffold320_size207635-snap-gene-1.13 protein:Tk09312 transcript:maker-scaffold320_size207635-snap-gene-1.13-mRNA-1 annotation:"growth factor receptor-bound protein 14-like isoform x2"
MKSFPKVNSEAGQSQVKQQQRSFFERFILLDHFTLEKSRLAQLSPGEMSTAGVQTPTVLNLPANKVVLNMSSTNGNANSHKRELEKEKSSVSTDSGTSCSTITNSSTGSSKLSKIGKRLRESCRNLRGKSSSKYSAEEYSTVQNTNDSNRTRHYVAMDFSGKVGRIVDQKDVRGYTTKDGYAYFRRKVSPKDIEPLLTKIQTTIHLEQPWFHPNMGRDLSQRVLASHNVDGVFLVRDSSVSGGYVISYVSSGRTFHAQILPDTPTSEPEGSAGVFFTLDDGKTRFYDLLQLVEFYQLNKGSLNSKLTHGVIRKEVTKSEESTTVRCEESSSGQVSETSSMESQTPTATSPILEQNGSGPPVASGEINGCCAKMDTNHNNSHDAKAKSSRGGANEELDCEDAAMGSEALQENFYKVTITWESAANVQRTLAQPHKVSVVAVSSYKNNPKPEHKSKTSNYGHCHRCGNKGEHPLRECYAKDAVCQKCQKIGHITSACYMGNTDPKIKEAIQVDTLVPDLWIVRGRGFQTAWISSLPS